MRYTTLFIFVQKVCKKGSWQRCRENELLQWKPTRRPTERGRTEHVSSKAQRSQKANHSLQELCSCYVMFWCLMHVCKRAVFGGEGKRARIPLCVRRRPSCSFASRSLFSRSREPKLYAPTFLPSRATSPLWGVESCFICHSCNYASVELTIRCVFRRVCVCGVVRFGEHGGDCCGVCVLVTALCISCLDRGGCCWVV